MITPFSEIGPQIRLLSNAQGITQEQLAEKADLSPTYISLIVTGVRSPSKDALTRIFDALGFHISYNIWPKSPPETETCDCGADKAQDGQPHTPECPARLPFSEEISSE